MARVIQEITKRFPEEYSAWAKKHDWEANGGVADVKKNQKDLDATMTTHGFGVATAMLMRVVIEPMTASKSLPVSFKEELQALCDQSEKKMTEERAEKAKADKEKKEGQAVGAVGKVEEGYTTFIASIKSQRQRREARNAISDLLGALSPKESEQFYRAVARVPHPDATFREIYACGDPAKAKDFLEKRRLINYE